MQIIGLARLGRDAEIRSTPSGDKVATLSLAFNYGKKDDSGKRPTQWVEGALWGKIAEALAPYLLKGTAVSVTIDEPHIETFDGKSGPGHKLTGRILTIELAGSQRDAAAPAPTPAPSRAPAPQPPRRAAADIDDDDIPF
jgi:single-strand DNA-binding protein